MRPRYFPYDMQNKEQIQKPRMPRRESKYGNVRTGGYDSIKERGRGTYLRMLQRSGHISELREQVRYTLIPAQYRTDSEGNRRLVERECAYVADFVYRDSGGALVVEDVKGFRTEVYRIKRKLMLHVHGILISEV